MRAALTGFFATSCTFLTVCTGFVQDGPAASAALPPASVRVMAFNIEWGGVHVSFAKVVEAIRKADPDIVAVQEAEGNLARLAAQFNWHYDLRNHVIARYPLIDPPGAEGRYVLAEVRPGHVVAIANVHLPSDPYGEDWIRDGRSAGAVVALEQRLRLPAIQPFLAVLPELAARGVPVFLAGDFNSPSDEDWQPAAIGRWPYRRYSLEWPVALAIRSAGFRDSYRQKHPDPLRHPGFTWWAERPVIPDYNPGPADSWQSRIDFIWYAGPAEVTRSTLVGEADTRDVTIAVTPWPSDHRAVLSDFTIESAPMPLLVAASRRLYRTGEAASITYNNRSPTGAVVISPLGADGEPGKPWRVAETTGRNGTVDLLALPPATGRYAVVLTDSEGETVSRNEFWVLPEDARPEIQILKTAYSGNEAISIAFRNAPGHRFDWVVIYPEGSVDRDGYLAWAHTGGRIEGDVSLGAASAVSGWPLPPGRYTASLMADDGFELLAVTEPFEVRAP